MSDLGLRSFEEVVAHYRSEDACCGEDELRWFSDQPTVLDAVRLAGLAQGPGGKRCPHQRRLTIATLEHSAHALLAAVHDLERCASFDDLFALVESLIGGIGGIGELTVYDTALRVGAKLGLHPKQVYLHAGTRRGAIALGLDGRPSAIRLESLPAPLNGLSARDAEDVLCIYKDDLARLSGRPR